MALTSFFGKFRRIQHNGEVKRRSLLFFPFSFFLVFLGRSCGGKSSPNHGRFIVILISKGTEIIGNQAMPSACCQSTEF